MTTTKDFREYRFGARGEHIKALQEALIKAGYNLPKFGADGYLGSETVTAVQQLEADHSFTDSLSWVIDASTLAFIGDTGCRLEPESPPSNPNVPRGKGMFQRLWEHMGDTPEEAAERCVAHSIKWVAVQRLWQYPNSDDDKWANGSGCNGHTLEAWASCLVAAGVQLWIWGCAMPGREDDFTSGMVRTAEDWGAVGIIVAAKGPWYQSGSARTEAENLMSRLQASGLPIGFMSYGAPWNVTAMPWEEFSAADFGVPQIYDSKNNQADGYPIRSVREWQELGFRSVVPASAAYNKTRAQMESLLARTPTPESAILWWDWYNANQAAYRWQVIGAHEVSSTEPGKILLA